MSSSPPRPGTFAVGDPSMGPGQYGPGDPNFANDVNGFTIGLKRPQTQDDTPGPGYYDPELADTITKPKTPLVDMGSSPSRPEKVGQTIIPTNPYSNLVFSSKKTTTVTIKSSHKRTISKVDQFSSLKPKANSGLTEPVRGKGGRRASNNGIR